MNLLIFSEAKLKNATMQYMLKYAPFLIFQWYISSQYVTILCPALHVRVPRTMVKDQALNLRKKQQSKCSNIIIKLIFVAKKQWTTINRYACSQGCGWEHMWTIYSKVYDVQIDVILCKEKKTIHTPRNHQQWYMTTVITITFYVGDRKSVV